MNGWVVMGWILTPALWLTVAVAAGVTIWAAVNGQWGWAILFAVYAVMGGDNAREHVRTMSRRANQ